MATVDALKWSNIPNLLMHSPESCPVRAVCEHMSRQYSTCSWWQRKWSMSPVAVTGRKTGM